MEFSPPVAVADFRSRRSAIARGLAVLRFLAVAARDSAAWLMPFGIVVGVVEMVAVVLCSGPRRGDEGERQEGDDKSKGDISPGRLLARLCLKPVSVKTATAAILLTASRPDLADLFRAPAAAVASVTFEVARSHHGLHYILPITLLDFRPSYGQSCALDHAACLLGIAVSVQQFFHTRRGRPTALSRWRAERAENPCPAHPQATATAARQVSIAAVRKPQQLIPIRRIPRA